MKPKAVVFPTKDFQFVVAPVAEDEPLIREGIECELYADDGGQSVNGFSEVRRTWCQMDFAYRFQL
jgi:hypothetical protein